MAETMERAVSERRGWSVLRSPEEPEPGEAGRGPRRVAGAEPPEDLELLLRVADPELVAALAAHPAGRAREQFALTALRIGVLALRQAEGRLDADVVRDEGEHLLAALGQQLAEHQRTASQQLGAALREYFDPESGRLAERLERLVRRDGELEQVLRRHLGEDDSELARTLARHVGAESPLLRRLDPEEASGIVSALAEHVRGELESQRTRILGEFTLDAPESALARLVRELDARHGTLERAVRERMESVTAEFSLDREDSALSRLMAHVGHAHEAIRSQFSLDEEGSALARMRRDLLEVLDAHRDGAARYQAEVRAALAAMQARREEAARSTRHGDAFELEVVRFVAAEAQRAGDVAEHVGATTGVVRSCKVGDAVLALGPESAAAGARIVVEAKQRGKVDLAAALAECERARKNRAAEVAVFVFSRRVAPEGLEPLGRYGPDVVAVWDADDPASDVFLRAALSVARALCTRAAAEREAAELDLGAFDAAVREVERQARGLDDIRTAAETIRGGAERILARARIVRAGLDRQVGVLDESLADLRRDLGA